MKFNYDKYFYLRNLKISLTLSLIVVILTFLILPKELIKKKSIPIYSEPVIKLIEIPPTNISTKSESKPIEPGINLNVDDPEFLPDIVSEDKITTGNQLTYNNEQIINNSENIENDIIMPQQILEILPSIDSKTKGTIKLELLIDEKGMVKEYKVISNTIKSKDKISEVIDAVLKSRWQPLTKNNKQIEYRIEKTYQFN
ncbi:energy transducer TonB [Rosettibacter firmus]|uniref:energy transducer TonB n=1 Tax=Rosettibacter firmus TaxID=3111522 RepID=UPI00336BE9D8